MTVRRRDRRGPPLASGAGEHRSLAHGMPQARPAGHPDPAHWLSNKFWRRNIQFIHLGSLENGPSGGIQYHNWSEVEHVSDARQPLTARLRPFGCGMANEAGCRCALDLSPDSGNA